MESSFTPQNPLADDPSFRAYVRQTDPEAVLKWTEWLARHPDRTADAEAATQLVRTLDRYVPNRLSAAQLDHEIARLQARVRADPAPDAPRTHAPDHNVPNRLVGRWRNYPLRWLAAASVGLLLSYAAVSSLKVTDNQLVDSNVPAPQALPGTLPNAPSVQPLLAQTNYGQRRTVRLPDGSVVTLNAHSTLTLSPDWSAGKREVTLDGEAYFRVSKQQRDGQPVKFVVWANRVAIHVLGTQFDVSTRQRRVKVVLNEGHIRLNVPENATNGPARTLDMLPGDLVEVTDKQAVMLNSRIQTTEHVAWVSDELVFDNTPLASIAETIHDNYGYTVEFANPDLATKRLTATLPDPNLDVLLRALEKAFSLTITRTNKTIRLAKAN